MDIKIVEKGVHMRKLWSFEVEMKYVTNSRKSTEVKVIGQLLSHHNVVVHLPRRGMRRDTEAHVKR